MIGAIVSHYKILEQLGSGGMGVVYKAHDTKLDRDVALKFLPHELTRDPQARERFVHEAKAASALQHPNICTIHDIDETPDSRLFIVMDCYEGESLRQRIERGSLSIDSSMEFVAQIAAGLAKAHESGIVHRDIKPANVMIGKDGLVRIVDFGLAKLAGQTVLTKTGRTPGTFAYMSPEQARGEPADCRTDIWSLGVTLYEALTRQRPFASDYDQAVVYSILNEDPKPIRELRPEVPEGIEKICRRAMQKDPKNRYQSAAEFVADLGSYRSGTQLSAKTRQVKKRNRRLVYSALAAAIFVVAMVVVFNTTGRGTIFDRVAVLPFQSLSIDVTQDYLADGMTEEVTARLQQIATLNVPSTRSTMQFKGSKASSAEIAHELGAKALVSGTMQIVNNKIRVIVKLLDPATDDLLWTEAYDGGTEDVLDLQSRIARAVAAAVRVEVTRDESARLGQSRRIDPEVYSTTLKAKAMLEYATGEGQIREAIGLFQKATNRDPTYAPAWAGLGEALWSLASVGMEFVAPAEVRSTALAAVEKALELDPNLADAHKARAVIAIDGEWDLEKAERHFTRALELRPGYAATHNLYGQILAGMPLRRIGEARGHFDRARELDPLSPWNDINMIAWWLNQGRPEQALEECEKARQKDPNLWVIRWQMGIVRLVLGRPAQAVVDLEAALTMIRPARPASVLAPLGLAYGLAARRTDASMILNEMNRAATKRYISSFYRAAVCSGLGQMDEAFRLLGQAIEERTPYLVFCTPYDPLSVSLRRDSRWKLFTDRLQNLVKLPEGHSDVY